MARRFAYCDLNVPWKKDDSLRQRLQMLGEFGCDIMAINLTVDDISIKTGKKAADKSNPIPLPTDIKVSDEVYNRLQEDHKRPMKLLTRFTAVLSDPSQVVRLQKDETIQSYDILAVRPTSEKMFQLACKEIEADIISLDLTQRLPYHLKAPAVGVAKQRGIHFEICYSPMIRDQGARLSTISEAQSLVGVSNGKNIIISSGCEKAMEVRSCFDVAVVAELFGFSEDMAKKTMTANCHDVLKHARARKTARGALSLDPIDSLPVGDQWKVPPDADIDDIDDVMAEGILLGDDDVRIKEEEEKYEGIRLGDDNIRIKGEDEEENRSAGKRLRQDEEDDDSPSVKKSKSP